MKTMIYSDFAMIRSYILQQGVLGVVIAFFLCWGMSSLYAVVPAVTFTGAFSLVFTIIALDENNHWERFRLSLPLSRKQIVVGRYLSALILAIIALILGIILLGVFTLIIQAGAGSLPFSEELVSQIDHFEWQGFAGVVVISIVGMLGFAALILPFTMKFGLTKAVRLIPFAFMLVIVIVSMIIGSSEAGLTVHITNFFATISTPKGMTIAIIGATLGIIVLYCISCFISIRLYENREF